MIKIAMLMSSDGLNLPVFLGDTDTGYYGKDLLRTPGVYEEEVGDRLDLGLAQLQGQIGAYATAGMFLLYDAKPAFANTPIDDITERISQYLTVPETAAKMLLRQEDEETQEVIEKSLATLKFYAGLTTSSKVFLPEQACKYLPEDVSKSMRSTRHVYAINSTDNLEIPQAECTSNFGIVLPDVEDIHKDERQVSSLDILRVTAPYRRQLRPGVYQYQGIFHTPYYKTDARLQGGGVPSYFNFINGFVKNDNLEVQANERHMYDNLYTLVCSDVARYVAEIMSGIFFQSKFGQQLSRLMKCHDAETAQRLATELKTDIPDGVTCDLTFTQVQELFDSGWSSEEMTKLVQKAVTVEPVAFDLMLKDLPVSSQVIDTERLPFVFELIDSAAEQFTENLIKRGVITMAMLKFLVSLCTAAYEVNWGHTGATRAIPHFVEPITISGDGKMLGMNQILAEYLASIFDNVPEKPGRRYLYATQSSSEGDDDSGYVEIDLDDLDEDEVTATFLYYLTTENRQRIRDNTLPRDYFSTKPSGAETTEASIIEYWRKVDGEQNLYYFLSSVYMETGDVRAIIECFIKLMRWGSVKPAMLVLENYPTVRTVFDLNTGMEVKNTAIVDESQLRQVNGCKHSFVSLLTAKDVVRPGIDSFVGVGLVKDYGEIQKVVVASFVDIGEMVASNTIDVAEFKGVQQFNVGEISSPITDLEGARFDFYTSERNIKCGLKYNTRPSILSEIALLTTPGVLTSVAYLKSKHNTMVITSKDRQYQILGAYVKTLAALYKRFPDIDTKTQVASTDILEWSEFAYKTFDKIMSGEAPDVNEARAGQAVSSMSLDLGTTGVAASIDFDSSPLEGKFALVVDREGESKIPPINFTDQTLVTVQQKTNNRIILLLLETDDKLIFCRKNLNPTEVLVKNRTISSMKYSQIKGVLDVLLTGAHRNVIGPLTGKTIAATLHESLKEFL